MLPRFSRSQQRSLWLRLHRWLGLSVALVFVLLGITGSVLVFYLEIDQRLNPQLAVDAECQPHSLDEQFASLQQAQPDRVGSWRLELPLWPQQPLTARYMTPHETRGEAFAPLMVAVNPCTLATTSRLWGHTLMTWVYQLHLELLLDLQGRLILAVVALLLLISLISGIWLWWPQRWNKWPQALRWRRSSHPLRNNLQLHNLAALYTLPVTLGLLLTGLILEQPGWFDPLLKTISPASPQPAMIQTAAADSAVSRQRASLQQVMATARAALPDGEIRWIYTPADANAAYMLRIYRPGDISHRFANHKVWVDQYSGQLLAVKTIVAHSHSERFMQWLHPLHNGEAFGLPGRIAVAVCGLLPLLLFITGLQRWRQKQRSQRDRKAAVG